METEDEEDLFPEDEKWNDVLEPPSDGLPAQIDDVSSMPGKSSTSGSMQGGKAKGHISRMELNTNKAGMDGLDKEKINKIIMKASLGSKYFENEQKKDQQVNERIRKILALKSKLMKNELAAAQVKVDEMVKELERTRDLSRIIVHIDMDMFYAAVEMLEKPELREKPMAVGGTHMLSTSNYVARRYGVRAGMPGFIGLKLCPNLVLVRPNFDKYRKYSKQVKEILEEYDPNFCSVSLDEAYLDFTEHLIKRRSMSEKDRTYFERVTNTPEGIDEKTEIKKEEGNENSDETCQSLSSGQTATSGESIDVDNLGEEISVDSGRGGCRDEDSGGKAHLFGISAEEAVREMRFRIEQKTNLTASAGIAPNCMLAKIASDMNKPNGQFVINSAREEVMKFISDLPVRKVSGIGKVMEKILSAVGVKSCTELYENRAMLYKLFAPISFNHFLKISLGLGSTYVGRDGERKSVSTERTFGGKSKPEDLFRICEELCESLAQDVEKHGLKGRTVTLKLKTVTFEVKNRSQSFPNGICSFKDMHSAARNLLHAEIKACRPHPLALRLMGVRLSAFLSEEEIQQQQKQGSLIAFFKKSASSKSTNTKAIQKADNSETIQKLENDSDQNVEIDMEEDRHLQHKPVCVSPHSSPSKDFHKETNTLPVSPAQSELFSTEDGPSKSLTYENNEELHQFTDTCENEDGTLSAESQRYLCPVCSVEKLYNSLEEFNHHVDMCLNKGEISTILHKQAKGEKATNVASTSSPAPKKRPSTSSSRSNKRLKTGRKRQYSTLDKFFVKNS